MNNYSGNLIFSTDTKGRIDPMVPVVSSFQHLNGNPNFARMKFNVTSIHILDVKNVILCYFDGQNDTPECECEFFKNLQLLDLFFEHFGDLDVENGKKFEVLDSFKKNAALPIARLPHYEYYLFDHIRELHFLTEIFFFRNGQFWFALPSFYEGSDVITSNDEKKKIHEYSTGRKELEIYRLPFESEKGVSFLDIDFKKVLVSIRMFVLFDSSALRIEENKVGLEKRMKLVKKLVELSCSKKTIFKIN